MIKENSGDSKFQNWFILILLSLIWGSSFILMKRGMQVYSSNQVAALRIFIAFLSVIPLAFKHIKKSLLIHWKGFLGMGMFGSLIPAFLFTAAQNGISSSLTAMLNSLTPVFTLIVGVLIFKDKPRWVNILGILMGFCGAIGLLMVSQGGAANTNVWYGFFVVFAAICNALAVSIIKKYLGGINAISCTVWSMVLVGPIAGAYLFTTDFTSRLASNPTAWQSLGYISILAVFSSVISVVLFNILIGRSSTLFATSVTYLLPIVAMGWGFLDNEELLPMHLIWIGLILIGVFLVNRKNAPEPGI
jgi:drug/metabolite transporter (DMT)-like permease